MQPRQLGASYILWDMVESEGVTQVGEVVTRTLREAIVEDDYRHAWIAGGTRALEAIVTRIDHITALAGPYDDTRALGELKTWAEDTIRRIHSPEFLSEATNGKLE